MSACANFADFLRLSGRSSGPPRRHVLFGLRCPSSGAQTPAPEGNHVPDSAVLQSVVDGTALVVFVLAVAVLSEYVFLNGYPLHRFVVARGRDPDGAAAAPLRGLDWPRSPLAVTWVVAVILGCLAVNFCQRGVVVPLDRALEERRHRRRLRELQDTLRDAGPVLGRSLGRSRRRVGRLRCPTPTTSGRQRAGRRLRARGHGGRSARPGEPPQAARRRLTPAPSAVEA